MEVYIRYAAISFSLLSVGCKWQSGESQFFQATQRQPAVVALRSTILKSSTVQSNRLPEDQFCRVNKGEKLVLTGSPLAVQSDNGTHIKISLAEQTVLNQPCRLREGYLFAEHIQQEYVQVNSPTNTAATPTPNFAVRTPVDTTPKQFIWPARQGVLASGFGQRGTAFHPGVDVALPTGSSVVAAANGKVVFAGWDSRYGKLVQLAHSGGYETIYAHNSDLLGTSVGKVVLQGDEIAKSGSTGLSTGPHIHFEIRQEGKAVNPEPLLPRWGGNR